MAVNTFNGLSIFGTAVKMRRAINERQSQNNAYPGLNAVEKLDMGLRGQITRVTGKLTGSSRPNLEAAVVLFESFYDNRAYVLEDNYGTAYASVVLLRFAPTSRPYAGLVGSSGVFCLDYEAEFQHLV